MDWENKHFVQQTLYQAPSEMVQEAVRVFAWESLAEWTIEESPGEFQLKNGRPAMHRATAVLRIRPAPGGTMVFVEMAVQRAGALGFMLVDIGGYYDGLLRKWLWGIWDALGKIHAARPWDAGHSPKPPDGAMAPVVARGARVAVLDPDGRAHIGVVREVAGQTVRVGFEAGGERWVTVLEAHVIV